MIYKYMVKQDGKYYNAGEEVPDINPQTTAEPDAKVDSPNEEPRPKRPYGRRSAETETST